MKFPKLKLPKLSVKNVAKLAVPFDPLTQTAVKAVQGKITKASLAKALVSPDPLTQAAAHKFLTKNKAKVKVSGDNGDMFAEPAVRRYLADNHMVVGFSLKSVKSAVKKVAKSPLVNPVKQVQMATKAVKAAAPAVSQLAKAAQTMGPMIASVYPPAGVAITAASALLKSAKAGSSEATAKLDSIKAAAAAGVDLAKQQMSVLNIADLANKAGDAQALIKAKMNGNSSAAQKIEEIKQAAARGVGEAVDSFKTLANAAAGLNAEPGGPVPAPVVGPHAGLSKNQMLAGAAVAAAGVAYLVVRRK